MGNQLKLLRFSPCYKSGGGIARLESLVNAKISLKAKKMNFFAPPLAYNVFGLGEVAFVRWLVCRKAILPNPCYTLFVLIFCAWANHLIIKK